MQLPTRSDIARVAGLVVSLEEKVDTIEDALEGLKERFAQAETSKAGDGRLEKRLQQIERKLDTLLATLKNDEAKVNPEAPPLGNGARRKVQKRHEDSPQANKTSTGNELP